MFCKVVVARVRGRRRHAGNVTVDPCQCLCSPSLFYSFRVSRRRTSQRVLQSCWGNVFYAKAFPECVCSLTLGRDVPQDAPAHLLCPPHIFQPLTIFWGVLMICGGLQQEDIRGSQHKAVVMASFSNQASPGNSRKSGSQHRGHMSTTIHEHSLILCCTSDPKQEVSWTCYTSLRRFADEGGLQLSPMSGSS